MNNYIQAMIHRMARVTGTILSDRHFEILNYTYEYFEKHKVGPLYLNLKKHIGATKAELQELFPHGLHSVYAWVGIPIQTPDKSCQPTVNVHVSSFRNVYLDHNATTYIRPEIAGILTKYVSGRKGYANPSSSSLQGKLAYDFIHQARKKIAAILHVTPYEIIFTGSGSESNNLAIKGVAFKNLKSGGHIITSKIEHQSILKPVQWLESIGFEATYLDVTCDGIVPPENVRKAIRKDTKLVSIMAVNNEIGTISPLREIGAICSEHGIPLIVDAIQGFGKIKFKPKELGISALSFSGHKIYAPKGVGGLYIDHDLLLEPLIHGGGQEYGIRSGTENVGYIIALGEAARLAYNERHREGNRLLQLQRFFIENLRRIEPGIIINGTIEKRVPWNLSISFPGIDSGALLLTLNSIGISVSAGSACSSGKIKTSHVLEAIHADTENYGTLRFSFGLRTTIDDLEYLLQYLPEILTKLKENPVKK